MKFKGSFFSDLFKIFVHIKEKFEKKELAGFYFSLKQGRRNNTLVPNVQISPEFTVDKNWVKP